MGENLAPSGSVMEIRSSSSAPHSTNTPEIPAPPSSPASGLGETSGQGESPAQSVPDTPSHPIDYSSDDDDGRDLSTPFNWVEVTPPLPDSPHASDQVERIGGRILDNDLASMDIEEALEAVAHLTVPSTVTDTGTDTDAAGNDELLDDASTAEAAMQPFAAPSVATDNVPDPKSYRAATCSAKPFSADWKIASDKEIKSHWENGTWSLVRLPFGRKAIGCTWVYKLNVENLGKSSSVKHGFAFAEIDRNLESITKRYLRRRLSTKRYGHFLLSRLTMIWKWSSLMSSRLFSMPILLILRSTWLSRTDMSSTTTMAFRMSASSTRQYTD